MQTCWLALLPDRAVFEVKGADSADFLQGLVTNDIARAGERRAVFAGLLTPQGKILFDFFIVKAGDAYLIEANAAQLPDLLKRLSFYKLRSKVEITGRSADFAVAALWGGEPALPGTITVFADPRHEPLGLRLILPKDETGNIASASACAAADAGAYHAHRISLAVPEGGKDYAYGDAFPHEACYDHLNGADFRKGCYVGQEVVSRMEHRGTARKRIVGVVSETPLPGSGSEITADGFSLGALGSVHGQQGIALVRLDRAQRALDEGQALLAGGVGVRLRQPPWARYAVPGVKKQP